MRETVPVMKLPGSDREVHPAFGFARVSRVSALPGEVLFQSDLRHREYVQVTISEAERTRDLKHDWVRATNLVCQFSMSLAQFASLVSSGGTEGVPVTLNRTSGSRPPDRPGLPYEPRLAVSLEETAGAAQEAFKDIANALLRYELTIAEKAPAAARRDALRALRAAVGNSASKVEFAAKSLSEYAEDVVERSRADIESMVAAADGVDFPLALPPGGKEQLSQ